MARLRRPKSKSLMRSVLLRIVLAASLVVGALTMMAYTFIYAGTQTRMLDNLSDWVVERARNDSVIFELAKENMTRFSDEFLRLYTSDIAVDEDVFWSYYETDQDNAVRMRREYYDGVYADDGLYYEGLTSFVGNNQSIDDPDLQRRLVLSVRLLAQLGPAWISRFQNVHVSFPENAIALYAPGTPWGLEAAPDLPMNELGVVRSMQQSENPDRDPGWSGLYYDETAEEWALTYQVPLDLDGRHLINPSHDVSLTAIMDKLVRDTPDGGYNLIFRSDGYLIAHPAEPASDRRWVGQLSPENIDDPAIVRMYELIDAATDGNPGTVSLVQNSVGGTWLAVSELSGPDWWFVSVYPESMIRASANQAAVAVLVTGIVLLLLLIFIIGFIIRRDAERPLEQLREAARCIGRGDYAAVADGRVKLPRELRNEVGLLANTFHDMAESIRDAQATLELIVAERTRELQAANSDLRELSLLDGLLGIHNRRAFDRDLARVCREAGTGHGEFHLMLIDVDHFKLFNDSYGHTQGDQVLRQIAKTISDAIRTEDRVYRYGGEELAVLFNRGDSESADSAAERIMAAVRELAIAFPESAHGIVTVSAGLMHGHAKHDRVDDVIAEADSRLYASKRKGRNCLTTSS
ncbi:sensor domain-containing diguanylate cyclase [Pseudohongiella sp.]|uniref:GGDEF domain-containing protein n=1 Tax=marine sediment metagenome TaxID=412755 RepID=A0A0F9P761_9ZZZZ|nr:diguanylate cyclase [Pseudohongiella sp.]HDZ08584.1 diguanylate cyclase [Pseudohongiella sp.]HEA61678.1 diguanylate cyclase [Pseudohongiella sp.]